MLHYLHYELLILETLPLQCIVATAEVGWFVVENSELKIYIAVEEWQISK